jgi:uncharacterized protein YgfB (UPF0149 family)
VSRNSEQFDMLASALVRSGSSSSVSELHGGLCGALCAGGPEAGVAWLERCMLDCENTPAAGARELLETLSTQSWRDLKGTEMEFAPLLPHEDDALDERVRALASWCNGFVTGLGLGGLHLDARLPGKEEIVEIVNDFIEIGKADVDVEGDAETAEASYAEIVEFVRVGAQLVFEEINGRAPGADGPAVH